MSGTNTICVVTALLETGMLPMTEPVTELTLEAPAGLIRVRADCARRQGHRRRPSATCPAFATHLDATVEVPHLGTVTVDVAYGGMFYVIADGRGVRAAADARRGRRHRPDHRDDQGRRERAAARRPPRAAGLRRDHDRPAVRAGPRPGELDAQRRDGLDRRARLGPARRRGPGAIDRSPCGTGHVGADGDASTPGAGSAIGEDVPARGHPRHGLHGPAARGDADRRPTRRSCRRSPARPGSPASPTTSSTRPTRSPTASRSATSGPDAARAGASAQEVAPAERQVVDRLDRQRPAVRA